VCKNCLYKDRPFPQNNEGNKNRGKICRLCERKFCVRLMLKEEISYISIQRKAIDEFQSQLADKKKQYNEIKKLLEDEAYKGKGAMEEL
jgi:hypothetical protein